MNKNIETMQNICNSTKTGNRSFSITGPSGFRPKNKKKKRRTKSSTRDEWQSASTWRHTSPSHAFPKEKRFSHTSMNNYDILVINIPEHRTSRTCSFGYGGRQAISPILIRKAQQCPPPNRYNFETFDEATRNSHKGVSFSSGRETQIARFSQHRRDVHSPHFTINNPGHIYNIRQKINAKPIKFGHKLKNFTQKMIDSKNFIPGPKYFPKDRKMANQFGLGNANFGTSARINFSKPMNENPGPQYLLGGMAEKSNKNGVFHAKYPFC